MATSLLTKTESPTSPIELVQTEGFDAWREELSTQAQLWLQQNQFTAKPGQIAWLPDDEGNPHRVVVGWSGKDDIATLGSLPFGLPTGIYHMTTAINELQALGWALGAYRFDRYRSSDRVPAQLLLPDEHNSERLANAESAITLTRDLINTPAGDMLPTALADEAQQVADAYGATCTITVGDDLLEQNFNAIHAVGRASIDPPRLIDIAWGREDHPRLTLVGKGVCFDSGGLDIKSAAGMRTMKKDMGGAAHVLGLAQLIMSQQLPVRLRVLVPAVENAISSNAYRPGDVLQTRNGITVEIDNTDAEGRLVLCDALALAVEDEPELIIDFSTLTGSARSAVGAEISAMFCNDDGIAQDIYQAGVGEDDPVWRLPLHQPYNHMLESKVADTVNSASSPYGGAITAALFLQKFVKDVPWVHFDIMAFNNRQRPGRPVGGEAMGLRAVFAYLQTRYAGH